MFQKVHRIQVNALRKKKNTEVVKEMSRGLDSQVLLLRLLLFLTVRIGFTVAYSADNFFSLPDFSPFLLFEC